MKKLYLAWQNPQTRRWFPIGCLMREEGVYRFAYVNGAEEAETQGGFGPLPSFPDLHKTYESKQLFPLFASRILNRSRPDYSAFLSWMSVSPGGEAGPLELLARSGGHRVTDHLEVFPMPEPDDQGTYLVRFFVHGLRHMPQDAVERANSLGPGDRLLVMHDFQNPSDPLALALRTAEGTQRDMHLIGYCPRYPFADSFDSMTKNEEWPRITIERVNPAPAPVRFRLLCRAEMQLDAGATPFADSKFQPLAKEPALV